MTIAAAVLAAAAFLLVRVELPPWALFGLAGGVALCVVPSFWALRWWLGYRYALTLAAVLSAVAVAVKFAASFAVGSLIDSAGENFRMLSAAAWALVWVPLMLGAYTVAANLFGGRVVRVLAAAVAVSLAGLIIDPVSMGISPPNAVWWPASGLIGAVAIEAVLSRAKPLLPAPVQLASGATLIVLFWSAVYGFGGLLVPALLGLAVFGALAVFYGKFHYAFDDKIVFVDESNTPIATGDKLPGHTDETKLHRAFSVFLFNPKGEFLMQQRALSKKTWPGVWSNSACGHVMLHETTEAAARRRLKYELGLSGIELHLALPDFRYRAEKDGVVENEICPVFVGVTDKPPRPNPLEVETVEWVDWDEFVASLDDPETDISPWAVEEVRELLASDVFARLAPAARNGSRAAAVR